MTNTDRRAVLTFWILAFLITWVVWVPRAMGTEWAVTLGAVWTYGPAVAAMVAAVIAGGRRGLGQLTSRLGRVNLGWRWYTIILLGPLLLAGAVALIGRILGEPWEAVTPEAFRMPLQTVVLLLVILTLTDGLGEELGWRGYALPKMLSRGNAVMVSLTLGLLWAGWHLPLFWTDGSALEGTSIWLLFARLPATAIMFTWIYRHTNGSMIAAALFHASLNLVSLPPPHLDQSPTPALITLALHWLVAIGLLLRTRRAGLPWPDRWQDQGNHGRAELADDMILRSSGGSSPSELVLAGRRDGKESPRGRRRRWRWSVTAAATPLILLISSCSGGVDGDGPPPPASEPASDATDTWGSLLVGISENGQVPVELALQAFSLAIAPIPGVEVAVEGPARVTSGGSAARWVLSHLDQLTDLQRTAVADALSPRTATGELLEKTDLRLAGFFPSPRLLAIGGQTAEALTASYRGCWDEPVLLDDAPGAATHRPALEQAMAGLSAKLGPLPARVYLGFTELADGAAVALPQNANCNRAADTCSILLTTQATSLNPDNLLAALTHELIHCYQGAAIPINQFKNRAPWQVEGFATWGTESLFGPTVFNGWWDTYLVDPTISLYQRSYDAIGFYEHAAETGNDPWQTFRPALAEATNTGAFRTIGGTNPAFANSWASSFATDPSRGPAWDTRGSTLSEERYTIPAESITSGEKLSIVIGNGAASLTHVNMSSDLFTVEMSGGGGGRLSFDKGFDQILNRGTASTFCSRPDGCRCPDGGLPSGLGELQQLTTSEGLVAVAGITGEATLALRGLSLDDFCTPTPGVSGNTSADHFDSCLIGSWTSDTFIDEGPLPELTREGGAGAQVTITKDGLVRYNYDAFEPMVGFDPQIDAVTAIWSSGTATARIQTSGNGIKELEYDDSALSHGLQSSSGGIKIDLALPAGPAVYVRLASNTSYTCTGGALTLTQPDLVDGGTITVGLRRS